MKGEWKKVQNCLSFNLFCSKLRNKLHFFVITQFQFLKQKDWSLIAFYMYIKTFKKSFDICDLSHKNVPYGLLFLNGQLYVCHPRRESAPTHRNKKYSAHHSQLFKNFLIRLTSSVQKFSSPIHPFSLIIRSNIYFCEPFIRSEIFIGHEWVQKFSSSIHPFHLIRLKNFRHPFIYHSSFILVICSSISRSISNGLAIRFSSIHLLCVHLKGMFSRERSHNLYSEEKSK